MSAFRLLTAPSALVFCLTVTALQAQVIRERIGVAPVAFVNAPNDTVAPVPTITADRVSLYERDALLVESYSFGEKLLKGKDRRVLATLNEFGTTNLADILARSSRAANEARVYDRNHRSGAFMMLGGLLGIFAGGVASQLGDGGGSYPLWLGGTLLIGSGSVRMNRAIHALPRAVWWYNHDLIAGN